MDKIILFTRDNPDNIKQFVNLNSNKGDLIFYTNLDNKITETNKTYLLDNFSQ